MILDTFPVLAQAYSLKVEYREFNRKSTYNEACDRFPKIARLLKNSGIRQYDEFTAILFNWPGRNTEFIHRKH